MGILDTRLFAIILASVVLAEMFGGGCNNPYTDVVKKGGEVNDASGITTLWVEDKRNNTITP